jgi:hypothetical protein
MHERWRRIAHRFRVANTASVIVWPITIWLITGSVGLSAAIYAAEAVLGILARSVARYMGLPAWCASESYITRLQHWQAERREPTGARRASWPS